MEQDQGQDTPTRAYSRGKKLFYRMAILVSTLFFAHNVFASIPITSTYYANHIVTDTIIAASCAPSPFFGAKACSAPSTFTCTSKEPCYQAAQTTNYYCFLVAPTSVTSYLDPFSSQWADCIAPASGNSVVGVIYSVTTSVTTSCPTGTTYYSPWDICYKGECPAGETLSGNYPYWSCKAQDVLTLVLSGGASSIEPWNKKHDPAHAKANVLFTAIVLDSKGMPKPNIPVSITTDVTAQSGGHLHTDGRPKGMLAATVADMATGTSTLTVKTDSSGLATFYFGAEEVSGEHKITATCTGCKTPATETLTVKVTDQNGGDLQMPDPFLSWYVLQDANREIGAIPGKHEHNHYLTKAAIEQLKILSLVYLTQVNYGKQLYLNDASLPWGGLYDVGSTPWHTPHAGHRKGVVIDIRAENSGGNNKGAIPKALFDDFSKKAAKKGINAALHCLQNGKLVIGAACYNIPENRHFHVQLFAGVDQ